MLTVQSIFFRLNIGRLFGSIALLAATLLGLAIPSFPVGSSTLSTQTFAISGQVTDGFGNAVSNATVILSGAQSGTTASDSNGNYSFPKSASGRQLQFGRFILRPARYDFFQREREQLKQRCNPESENTFL